MLSEQCRIAVLLSLFIDFGYVQLSYAVIFVYFSCADFETCSHNGTWNQNPMLFENKQEENWESCRILECAQLDAQFSLFLSL